MNKNSWIKLIIFSIFQSVKVKIQKACQNCKKTFCIFFKRWRVFFFRFLTLLIATTIASVTCNASGQLLENNSEMEDVYSNTILDYSHVDFSDVGVDEFRRPPAGISPPPPNNSAHKISINYFFLIISFFFFTFAINNWKWYYLWRK